MEEKEKSGHFLHVLCSFLCAVTSVLTFSVCLGLRADLQKSEPVVASGTEEAVTVEQAEEKEPICYIGIRDGKVAAWDADGTVLRIFEAKPLFLPEQERENLQKSIAVYSQEEFYRIAENYME